MPHFIKALFAFFLIAALPVSAMAADHHESDGSVKTIKLSDNIYMLQAGGGNIGVSAGEQGIFVIDSDYDGKGEALLSAIHDIQDGEIELLVNTHWHFDHTGSNAHLHDHGDALIMAHENVRKRLKAGQEVPALDKTIPPAEESALPVVTYTHATKVHLNGEEAQLITLDPAHTDGDTFVYWPQSNIIHTGDVFFNGFYPFIDGSSGGSLRGMIAATARVLELADDETKIIPGHGPLANKADLEAFRGFLVTVEQRLAEAKGAETSLEDWIASEPVADFEDEWGDGFLDTKSWLSIIWDAH